MVTFANRPVPAAGAVHTGGASRRAYVRMEDGPRRRDRASSRSFFNFRSVPLHGSLVAPNKANAIFLNNEAKINYGIRAPKNKAVFGSLGVGTGRGPVAPNKANFGRLDRPAGVGGW